MAMPRDAAARRGWDAPARPPALERFYRHLMSVDQLPSAPEVAQRMLVTINRDDASLRELTDLIARDQALTARLLRLANSAFFAIRSRVTSIPQAVTLLGFARVRDLVLGLSVWGALEGKSEAARRHRKTMWTHTAMVAAVAKMLAQRTGRDGPEAFAAGLLHDVGKLVLGLRLGDSYWQMLDDAAAHGESVAPLETAAFGCHHATVGGWLLQLWRLPPALVDPVALHHEPLGDRAGLDLPAIVGVSDRLVNTSASGAGAITRALEEIEAFAPGVLDVGLWHELHSGLAQEQQAIAGLFD